MKVNARDVIAGGLLVLFAAVALWLNADHTLGTARRMGPGYMPMLVLWLQLGLGAFVLVLGLGNGPDPLENWTNLEVATAVGGAITTVVVTMVLENMGVGQGTWRQLGFGLLAGTLVLGIAPGWRPLGVVHAAFAIFGLSLEPLGLIVAMTLCILLASLADRDHTPLGVAGMVVVLCVLCWFVFIRELDIRVPLWPTIF